MTTESLITFYFAVLFGSFCAYLAKEKRRNSLNWFILGFFFNILALIVLVGLPIFNHQRQIIQSSNENAAILPSIPLKTKIFRFALIFIVSSLALALAIIVKNLVGETYPNLF